MRCISVIIKDISWKKSIQAQMTQQMTT